MATLIQIRRDSQANWVLNDPVLASGEIAFSSDQDKLKIGNGNSLWSELTYINALPSEITAEINAAISSLVGDAPELLDTLSELAAAINDDASFSTTVNSAISSAIDAIDTDAIEEGSTNLYFTDARAQAAVATDISNAIDAVDTDDIEEGATNLYFTESRAQDATPGRVTASATAPSSPSNGDGWLDLEDGSLYIYVNDGDTSQWIQA